MTQPFVPEATGLFSGEENAGDYAKDAEEEFHVECADDILAINTHEGTVSSFVEDALETRTNIKAESPRRDYKDDGPLSRANVIAPTSKSFVC
jgi:hypothetical protein